MIDAKVRELTSRALAKALAFKACGQDAKAQAWATELVWLLDCVDILSDEAVQIKTQRDLEGGDLP